MDSPPSSSAWSEAAFLLSDDSGLLLTSGSVSSGSVSGESRSGRYKLNMELLESDGEDKSLSQADSLDGMSDGGMCGENFNTLKKGPTTNVWCVSIEPPPEFQDDPDLPPTPPPRQHHHQRLPIWLDKLSTHLMKSVIEDALTICCKVTWSIHYSPDSVAVVKPPRFVHNMIIPRLCWTPELFSYSSPCHHHSQSQSIRPNSRNSLTPSRLSSSHNSLHLLTSCHGRVNDSTNFITQAVSHDALLNNNGISDIYNVPFDSDIYAVPVDVVKPRVQRTVSNIDKGRYYQRKRRRNASSSSHIELPLSITLAGSASENTSSVKQSNKAQVDIANGKRHSVPGTTTGIHNDNLIEKCNDENEPIHMTLQEVRQYLQTLYSSSSSSDYSSTIDNNKNNKSKKIPQNSTSTTSKPVISNGVCNARKTKRNTFVINLKKNNKPNKTETNNNNTKVVEKRKKSPTSSSSTTSSTSLALGCSGGSRSIFSSVNFKHTICNLFRFRTKLSTAASSPEHDKNNVDENTTEVIQKRALPPLPANNNNNKNEVVPTASTEDTVVIESADEELSMDFATNIEQVKNYGWYWGPISAQAAEKILSNEPEGSFIVRDSSDDHYIFSLSFKLNGCVRHVRIENYQGNFSFGSCTKFKSHTIVEFIENAVEHSRSGRYLFFLHRRPVLGPMRVQLLHPVSRFKQVQSLQHMCRFVIKNFVRRDYIANLPLPRRIIDYLSMKHYYSEMLSESDDSDGDNSNGSEQQTESDQADGERIEDNNERAEYS